MFIELTSYELLTSMKQIKKIIIKFFCLYLATHYAEFHDDLDESQYEIRHRCTVYYAALVDELITSTHIMLCNTIGMFQNDTSTYFDQIILPLTMLNSRTY